MSGRSTNAPRASGGLVARERLELRGAAAPADEALLRDPRGCEQHAHGWRPPRGVRNGEARARLRFLEREHDLVREPDAGDPQVRFDERRLETESWRGVGRRHWAKSHREQLLPPYAYHYRSSRRLYSKKQGAVLDTCTVMVRGRRVAVRCGCGRAASRGRVWRSTSGKGISTISTGGRWTTGRRP